jgi:hypothetical protein
MESEQKVGCGEIGVFAGGFAKSGWLDMVFCGEVVVDCVVKRGPLMVVFWRLGLGQVV